VLGSAGQLGRLRERQRLALAAGIAAGAVFHGLQDLHRKVAQLPEGDLRDAWLQAASKMQLALDEAVDVHRRTIGGRP
jgi:hypothetical protein